MRYRILTGLAFCAIVIAATGCRHQHVITPAQAMDAVRAFEGDSALQLVCSDLKEFKEGPEWAHEKTYDLDDIEGAPRRRSWTVDAVTGNVTGASYHDAHPRIMTWDEPTGPLTQEQCRQVAEDFARSKCSQFDTMGLRLREQEWNGDGWSFDWQQKVAYGAWTPNGVSVQVNPADGRIEMYSCGRMIEMPAPQAPQITAQQAVDAVRIYRGLPTAYDPASSSLFATPEGMFWILIDFWGEDAQGKSYRCNARVNAMTGDVVSISELFTSEPHTKPSAPKKSPPTPAKSKQTGSTR